MLVFVISLNSNTKSALIIVGLNIHMSVKDDDCEYCSAKEWLKQIVLLTGAVVCFRRYLKPFGSPKKEKKREITYIPEACS